MKIIGMLVLTLGFFQCKSLSFDQNPPFTINTASYTYHTGGMPGVSSTTLLIDYNASENVYFENVYFQGYVTKIEQITVKNKNVLKGNFNTSTVNSKNDLILHKDGNKEMGNTLPKKKIPFELKENEAVISYKEGETIKYYKVENIKAGKTKFYQ